MTLLCHPIDYTFRAIELRYVLSVHKADRLGLASSPDNRPS
jgi:hypothetical protein